VRSGAEAVNLVARVLRQQGWDDASELTPGDFADLIVRHDGRVIAAAVKPVSYRGIGDVIAALSRTVLEARLAATRLASSPLAAVVVPRLGERMAQEVAAFMAAHAPDVAWLLADEDGGVCLSLDRHVDYLAPAPRLVDQDGVPAREVFSDLHQWLLKILLLQHAPERYWSGPRPVPGSIPLLAKAARVSVQKAYQFVAAFEQHGHLRRDRGRLCLVRREELFEAWFEHQRFHPPQRLAVRGLFGPCRDLPARLRSEEGVVGGFEACTRMDLLHTQAGLLELHAVVAPASLLAAYDLEPCPESVADLVLLRSRHRESVRRGCHDVAGVPVVDPLQAALDVAVHDARGREQAGYLRERILSWGGES
jgi:hypothetical protein